MGSPPGCVFGALDRNAGHVLRENTSSSASLRLSLFQRPRAWLSGSSRPNTRLRMTLLVLSLGFSVPRTRRRSIINFEDEPEVTSEADASGKAANPTPGPGAAAPVVVAAPPPIATASLAASQHPRFPNSRHRHIFRNRLSEAEEATQ